MRCAGLIICTVLLVALSCRDVAPPEQYFPKTAVLLLPVPSVYSTWWSDTETCSGVKRSFSAVRFYVVPGATGWQVGSTYILGAWAENGNRITVGEYRKLEPLLLRHEMLHAILSRGDHPRDYFVTRCGQLVDTLSLAEMEPRD